MTNIPTKQPSEYGVLDLANSFVEEIWNLKGISKAVYGGNDGLIDDLAWGQFALGWAISKGVPLEVAQKFVKRYQGTFNPERVISRRDAA